MTRLVDMVAGAGWLFLLLFIARHFRQRFVGSRRDRAIDKAIAKNRTASGRPPMNRRQRRAAASRAGKAKKA